MRVPAQLPTSQSVESTEEPTDTGHKALMPGVNLGQRTLSVYLNGFRLGAAVAPWIEPLRAVELRGPLRWVVDVGGGSSWRIERKPPPQTLTEAEMEAEIAACKAWQESLLPEPEPAPQWIERLDESGVPHGQRGE